MASSSIQIPGYEILRPLGTGGMSTVYLAIQRSLERKVAIKVMRRGGDASADDSSQAEKRFLLEGRMMAKLPHRNIVAVYDIVSNEAMAYISMEFLDGGTLSDRMREGISLADAVSVIVQIASALDFAHTHGVVHRDLKPANIMFRDVGTPVLTDFGIARYQDATATRLTQTGMLVGTPTYMSPEQINGQNVDGRADLYSLGILFYELLAGHAPFRGDTPIAVLMAHLTQQPPPLPDEHVAFQPVMDRMLAKNRDERYTGMKEFSQDLKSRLINSNTLLMRLNVDPNAPSSEQLRALGFASTPTGQGLRDSLLGSLPTPRPTPLPAVPGLTAPETLTRPRKPSMMTIVAADRHRAGDHRRVDGVPRPRRIEQGRAGTGRPVARSRRASHHLEPTGHARRRQRVRVSAKNPAEGSGKSARGADARADRAETRAANPRPRSPPARSTKRPISTTRRC